MACLCLPRVNFLSSGRVTTEIRAEEECGHWTLMALMAGPCPAHPPLSSVYIVLTLGCTGAGTGLMAGPSWRCGLKKPGLLLSFCLLGADKLHRKI